MIASPFVNEHPTASHALIGNGKDIPLRVRAMCLQCSHRWSPSALPDTPLLPVEIGCTVTRVFLHPTDVEEIERMLEKDKTND